MTDTKYLVAHTPEGTPVYTCACGKEWLEWFTKMGVHQGLIKTNWDIWQGGYRGGATAASAGTHDGGGVLDLAQNDEKVILLERQMGAAGWYRDPSTGLSGENHLVLIGCPHHPKADYQVTAYKAGYDGLGDGYKRRDPGPRVSPIRTWSQGVAWAKTQLQEDDVISDKDIQRIAAAIHSQKIGRTGVSFGVLGEKLLKGQITTDAAVSDSTADKIARKVHGVKLGKSQVTIGMVLQKLAGKLGL